MRILAIALIGLVAGCGANDNPDYGAYYEHPSDPQVEAHMFETCLDKSKPIQRTHYNDQDEVVQECGNHAQDMARYCPLPDLNGCLPQYRRSKADVRAVLPQDQPNDQTN